MKLYHSNTKLWQAGAIFTKTWEITTQKWSFVRGLRTACWNNIPDPCSLHVKSSCKSQTRHNSELEQPLNSAKVPFWYWSVFGHWTTNCTLLWDNNKCQQQRFTGLVFLGDCHQLTDSQGSKNLLKMPHEIKLHTVRFTKPPTPPKALQDWLSGIPVGAHLMRPSLQYLQP